MFTPGSYRAGKVYSLDRYPGMTCGFCQQRPASVGYVKARSADPFESPSVQPNYLAAEYDQQVVVAALKMVRRFMQTPEMAQFFDSETLPGTSVSDDDALLGFARQYGITSFHFAGTSKMGPPGDPWAVVNPQLQVHGIEGLRIADASVMPMITSAVPPTGSPAAYFTACGLCGCTFGRASCWSIAGAGRNSASSHSVA